jgi:DNA-binding response OmpR family regulator
MSDSKTCIVVADDDLDICELLDSCFGQAGFDVHTTVDGMKALALIRDIHPDVVLLDVVMPLMSGTEVLRQLKLDSTISNIPVILFSAKTIHTEGDEADVLGVAAFIAKPFNLRNLVALVEKIVAEHKN